MKRQEMINKVAGIARKAISVGGDVAGVVVHLRGDPTPLGIASAVVKGADSLMRLHNPAGPLQAFRVLPIGRAHSIVKEVLKLSGLLRAIPHKQQERCWEFVCGEVRCRWVEEHDGSSSSVYYHSDCDVALVKKVLSELVWEIFGPRVLFLPGSKWGDDPLLASDAVGKSEDSALAKDLWARMHPLRDAGIPVSALLYGPPGTGKSCIARRIVGYAGGRSLRVTADSIGYSNSFGTVIEFLKPSAVIIDDLDRGVGAVLENFDELRSRTMVIASLNSMDKVDSALLRPGRFDEVVYVEKLDEAAMSALLKGVPSSDAKRLRELPVAYVERYLQLRKHAGQEVASGQIGDLEARYAMISEKDKEEGDPEDEEKEAPPCPE